MTINDMALQHMQAISFMFGNDGIRGTFVGNPVKGATNLTYYVNLHNPKDINKILNMEDSLALGCRSESVFIYRNKGIIEIQVSLPVEYRTRVERGYNVTGKQVGLITSKKHVNHSLNGAPHTLVTGTTRAGKSILTANVLLGLMETYSPNDLKIVLSDPNTDYDDFENLPHFINFEYGYRSITPDEHMATLLWMERTFEYRRANAIKDDYKLLYVIDEAEQVGKFDNIFWDTLDTVVAQGAKYGIHVLLTSKKPTAKQIPIIDLLTNRYIGRQEIDKATAARLIKTADLINPTKLSLRGDFIHESDTHFGRFQVANIRQAIFDSLNRGTIFNELAYVNNKSDVEYVEKKRGRPTVTIDPELLAWYAWKRFKVTEYAATKAGITQTQHYKHMEFGQKFLQTLRSLMGKDN